VVRAFFSFYDRFGLSAILLFSLISDAGVSCRQSFFLFSPSRKIPFSASQMSSSFFGLCCESPLRCWGEFKNPFLALVLGGGSFRLGFSPLQFMRCAPFAVNSYFFAPCCHHPGTSFSVSLFFTRNRSPRTKSRRFFFLVGSFLHRRETLCLFHLLPAYTIAFFFSQVDLESRVPVSPPQLCFPLVPSSVCIFPFFSSPKNRPPRRWGDEFAFFFLGVFMNDAG